MALHPRFPKSPYDVLLPEHRWFPADEILREKGYEKLLPPLVANLRKRVKEWRDAGYDGASSTSLALLRYWFQEEHLIMGPNGVTDTFQYYYAQREAIETIIYLHEIAKVKEKHDLIKFDITGKISPSMIPENWNRFVVKMATGSGKTKVLSLVLAWCYFHKQYEPGSTLAQNFLVIAPNIIVLDRLRTDFDGLSIFFHDPVLPYNGYEGHNWRDDFQVTLHIQDQVHVSSKTGNIFLTNIHRVYECDTKEASYEDEDQSEYFLGPKPVTQTNASMVDLGAIVRSVDELVVMNDEAHHMHDERMAWFKSIQDIHNRMLMKGGGISLQVDVTATPRHDNGAIFVQTVCDYPLVEAIYQDIVKHPVVPDEASRGKLREKNSAVYSERYADYLHLGYLEWKKVYDEQQKMGKKAVMFVMTDDTRNCDEVAEYLESRYPDLHGAILTIHTKRNGEISEASGKKDKEELERLRKAANEIDRLDSPYKAIVSVLMLKEGWDVKNVTTIVGLRAYTASSNILPEQTLGRGLRRMYRGQNIPEYLSVVGTPAFMDFVESIRSEGVVLERKKMGPDTPPLGPVVVEVEQDNPNKKVEDMEIEIPVLSPRIQREYKNLSELNLATFEFQKIYPIEFTDEEKREIVFKDVATGEKTHITKMDAGEGIDYGSVIGYFARTIMKELRLVSGYDLLYGLVKEFIANHLFVTPMPLEDPNTIRNLSETQATMAIVETFKREINKLTVVDKGEAEVRNYIKVSQVRPFTAKDQSYLVPRKSLFNKIIGDSQLELDFAAFLENCPDIVSYTKNYMAVGFKIDYQDAEGNLTNFIPDFVIKKSSRERFFVETKGLEDKDVPLKMERLKRWCEDINGKNLGFTFDFVFVDEDGFRKYKPKTFGDLISSFRRFK